MFNDSPAHYGPYLLAYTASENLVTSEVIRRAELSLPSHLKALKSPSLVDGHGLQQDGVEATSLLTSEHPRLIALRALCHSGAGGGPLCAYGNMALDLCKLNTPGT